MLAAVGAAHETRAAAAASASASPAGVRYLGGYGPGFDNAYRAAGIDGPDTVAWWPTRSSADGIALPAKDLTLARVRDVVRNDPNARAAVERLVDLIVGPGLTLAAIPDGAALGISDVRVLRAFGRQIQTEWRLFAKDPRRFVDASRKLSENGLFRLWARTKIIGGECCYALRWMERPGARYATCALAVDPDRLCNPDEQPETPTLRGGVEMDTAGSAIAYHVRNAHLGDWWAATEAATWTRIPRETAWGRPVFVHAFEPEREGETRPVSPFAALITRLRMIGKFGDTELASAAANALYAAFVETNLTPGAVADRLTPTDMAHADKAIDYLAKNPAKVGGVRIPVLPPGTTIKMNNTQRQSMSFAAFQTAFLQSIASALGISYEQLSMDWSRTNYSSARAALNEVWRGIERMRAIFVEQAVTPLFYAFLEEAIDKGYVRVPKPCKPRQAPGAGHNGGPPLDPDETAPPTAPDLADTYAALDPDAALDLFHAKPGAMLRAMWIGPGRGIIDPLKEAEANALELESLTTTLRHECAERGMDYEEVLDQIAIETADLKDRGLSRMSLVAAVQSNRGPKPDSEEATSRVGAGSGHGGGTQDN